MPNGASILIDSGHTPGADVHPRQEIASDLAARGSQPLTMFINSNADHDHVSDLHNVWPLLRPKVLLKNPTIASATIRAIKEQPLTQGLEALCGMSDEYCNSVPWPDLGGVEIRTFHHPISTFGDTNNSSVVTFFFYQTLGIVFPGDLEKTGWEAHLKNPEFVRCLERTNIFVASHHGRENGYCSEVFAHCKPDIVVISDKSVEHGTQEHSLYQPHASGILFGEERRKVLSTRSDGSMLLWTEPNRWLIRLGV